MTIAVCLKCGEFKRGAFTPCRKCGYLPDDDESLTKHLLVSDHYHSRAALQAIADRVKSGQAINFDPETLKQAWVSKQEMDAETKRLGWGCSVVFAVAIAAVVAVVLIVAYLIS